MRDEIPTYNTTQYDWGTIDKKCILHYVIPELKIGSFEPIKLSAIEDLTCRIVDIKFNVELTFLRGELHSFNDEPAVLWNTNNIVGWYQHGVPHRTSGPAGILGDGKKEWWLWGIKMEESAVFLYNLDKAYENFLKKKYKPIT